MTNDDERRDQTVRTDTTVPPTREVPTREAPTREVVMERRVETAVPPTEKRSWVGPFVAGFLTATIAFAIGIGIFLVVSDADDDGVIELDVPAVEVNE